MPLELRDRLAVLMPSAFYYQRKIADEAAWGEHELNVLGDIVEPHGTAVDVGANSGFYSFAFSKIVDRVEAFEPNPDFAGLARRMLGTRARVHQIALSNKMGPAEFVVPISEQGVDLHLAGSLLSADSRPSRARRFVVEVRTLDSYAFEQVRVLKVDVEGNEMEVLEGGRDTILRDRPALIVELLTGTHPDPIRLTEQICGTYGYSSWLVTKDRQLVEAFPVLRNLASNTTWGSPILNRNVLFLQNDSTLARSITRQAIRSAGSRPSG